MGEIGSIFPFLLVKGLRLVLVVLLVMVVLFERREVIGNQMPARTVLEATLSIGSVHGSYGVGGLDKQSKIVGLFCSEILSFSEVTEY